MITYILIFLWPSENSIPDIFHLCLFFIYRYQVSDILRFLEWKGRQGYALKQHEFIF